jgi:hypothetical protein
MKSVIRERRRVPFEYRRITPDTIRAISAIIEEEISSLSKKDDYYILYSIDATDNFFYESESNQIFSENEIIEKRIIKKVSMKFYTKNNSKNIDVLITHSLKNENLENYILVSGDDKNWVNGVLSRLSEVIELCEKQPKIGNMSGIIMFLTLILFNVVYFRYCYSYITDIISNGLLIMFFMLGIPVLSFVCTIKFLDYIDNLWPSIELQTGPNYQQIPKINRDKAMLIFLSVFLPLLLAFIYDLIKSNL